MKSEVTKGQDEKIVFDVTNLVFRRDHFTLNLDGYIIDVRQVDNYEIIEKSLRKNKIQSVVTAQIIVNAKHEKQDEVRRIINQLCWLMSFAKGNTICPVKEMHFKGKSVVYQIRRSMNVEPFQGGNYVISEFGHFPKFLGETYPNYKTYQKELGLDVVFNYYELIKRNQFLDVRCLLAFILLECLSFNAQEYFKRNGNPIRSSLEASKLKQLSRILYDGKELPKDKVEKLKEKKLIYSHPTLQDSIDHLMNKFRMDYKDNNEKDIFSLRKDFIHKGRFPEGVDGFKIFNQLIHFIDRLILHILGYTGEYLDISDGYKNKKLEYNSPSTN